MDLEGFLFFEWIKSNSGKLSWQKFHNCLQGFPQVARDFPKSCSKNNQKLFFSNESCSKKYKLFLVSLQDANLSTKSCFDISELEDIYRNCSECKQLPETKKVARNTRRCQKIAEQLVESPNCLACEFTVHYTCKKAEMNLKSTTTNGFNFRIINSLMESWRQSPPAHYSDLFPPNNIVQYKNQVVIFYVIQCIQVRDSLQSVQ